MHLLSLIIVMLATSPVDTSNSKPVFELTYPAAVGDTFSGSVYLMFSDSTMGRPADGPDWFNTKPFYRVDVEDWKPDTPLIMDNQTVGFPGTLEELKPGTWRVQGVMRSDPDFASVAGGTCVISQVVDLDHDGSTRWPVTISIDEPSSPRPFPAIPNSEFLKYRSERLSKFHDRDVHMKAAAFFPPDFGEEPGRKWPVIYVIGGFPGGMNQAPMTTMLWGTYAGNTDFVIVYLGAESETGHHVFADSNNNGPYGSALVQEFIPWLEAKYPFRPEASGRLLTGHSSGGWSSLWLQVNYPQTFGGTWSTAPDPVDFRAFQEVDIYAEHGNAYRKKDGSPTRVARKGPTTPALDLEQFCRMEETLGDGGQIRSFEWVFSPSDGNGRPMALFDRASGEIDASVAEAWKDYDISLHLMENWEALKPHLEGKIHVYMGNEDTFYLEKAVQLMQARCLEKEMDVEIVIMPGDHSSILFGNLSREILQDMKRTAETTP